MSASIAPSPFSRASFTAFTLPDGSKGGFCSEDAMQCVHGHRLKMNAVLSTDGIVNCMSQSPVDQSRCNADLWVALLHVGGSAVEKYVGTRLWVVVELTAEKRRHLIRTPMTVMEKLAYLQLTLPGVRS